MSLYTTEVRFICEAYAGEKKSQELNKVSEILENSWDKVFDFDFPIFDEAYRKLLCIKILRHYYTREIGLETVGLWKLKLETKMNEIMPYYNKLYESETYKYNPLYDADYTRSHTGNDEGESTENGDRSGSGRNVINKEGNIDDSGSHSVSGSGRDIINKEGNIDDSGSNNKNGNSWNVYSDTPQGALTNVDNETYLTDARKITEAEVATNSNNRDYDEESTENKNYQETGTQGNNRDYDEESTENRTYAESNEVTKNFSNTNEYVEHVIGKMPGSNYSKMIMEYRNTLLNIDMLIIEQLSGLFFKLWR